MSSPCELLGYEEGMEFIIVNDNTNFDVADHVWLISDDGSDEPFFSKERGSRRENAGVYCVELPDVARVIEGKSPAQARGFKEGDIFILNRDDDGESAEEGTELTLIRDDGSTYPKFSFTDTDGDDSEGYFYLGQLDGLDAEEGYQVRVIFNATNGLPDGTEGIIVEVCDDGDYQIKALGQTMYHHSDSCQVYGYAKESQPSAPEQWTTKPLSEWKVGDKGIIRAQQKINPHNFAIGAEATCIEVRAGYVLMESPSLSRSQCINPEVIEVVSDEAKGSNPSMVVLDELADVSGKHKYFIDGDSIEVTLVGYFEGEPICAYKDRWGDIQTFVAKQSLLVSDDD
jgi:hypothetical protein